MHASHERALKALDRRGRLRALSPRAGLDFSSNDYLGLANSDALRSAAAGALERGVAIGAMGSRLLRGNDPEHEALEFQAADFFAGPSCLFFSGGYAANVSILSTLPGRGDLIVADGLAHASMIDGLTASKAKHVFARHNDAQDFEDKIAAWRQNGGTGRAWIVTESLFSMDGDRAPLPHLVSVASRHDAMLVVDEAHATGVFGDRGRGLTADLERNDSLITIHTCGKALGAMGALVVLPCQQRDFLINRARAFIYATAPSPLIAAIVRGALEICGDSEAARQTLQDRTVLLKQLLQERLGVAATDTQIQPLIVGSDSRATALAAALQAGGFDVRAVRPPTVPEGTARLRIALTLNVEDDDVRQLVEAISQEWDKCKS
jgi:8-amino-7-oxononanoate synthase